MRALTVPICRGIGSVCENHSEKAWSQKVGFRTDLVEGYSAIVSRESFPKQRSKPEGMHDRET